MAIPSYVVDANILAKWIFPGEPYEEAALRLKDDDVKGIVSLHSPGISLYELSNVLWKAIKRSRITKKDALGALEAINSLGITTHELGEGDFPKVLAIASQADVTAYDASYLYLGVKLSLPLLTADEELSANSSSKISGCNVVRLKDY